MDFFDHQDQARKSTGRLVVLFALAVVATVVLVHIGVGAIWLLVQSRVETQSGGGAVDWSMLVDWRLLLAVAGVTLLVIGAGSAFKLAQLAGGGRVVAERLGGRRLHQDTTDLTERRVLNVVEEMAIASGVPMPPVYFMDKELGINAFAAGFSPGDAVIGVTRGCAENLSRDELQGVMAHEFSHILNGDMRLNLRLIGVLHGILIISLIGSTIMRMMWYTSYSRRSSKEEGAARMGVALVGLILMVVGYVGWFFGTWIKSAVSRQREFLADASAVQFTRNPGGIAGALKQILGHAKRARLVHPHAAEASHMFFGSGVSAMFATHPPLPTRIKRIDPNWTGKIPVQEAQEPAPQGEKESTGPTREQIFTDVLGGAVAGAAIEGQAPAAAPLMGQIGSIDRPHLEYARQLLERVPQPLRNATQEPYGARGVVYAMLMDPDETVQRKQLERLASHADPAVAQLTSQLIEPAQSMERAARLPLVDLALGTLRGLTEPQYQVFKANLVELVKADRRIDLFEWSLGRILLRHLDREFLKSAPTRVRHVALGNLGEECSTMLSALARAGHRDEGAAETAVSLGAQRLGIGGVRLLTSEQSGLDDLDRALDELCGVAPTVKRSLIEACAITVAADGRVRAAEAELLRAIADSLDVPIPPLLPGQPLFAGH